MAMQAKWKALLTRFEALPAAVKAYFDEYPPLLENYSWNVSWGYLFSRLEAAHRLALYIGVVKRHRVNADKAWDAIDAWYMTREDFDRIFKAIFGVEVPPALVATRKQAEKVRDLNFHGKDVDDPSQLNGQRAALEYAEGFHTLVEAAGGPSPFGELRGFAPGEKLSEATSYLVLKGLGFYSK